MPIESAKKKIEEEAKACGGLEKAIVRHLIEIMDEELAVLVNRPEYTVKEMGAFVMGKARKELNGKSGALEDEVVFGFATDYYHASRNEIQGTALSNSMTSVKASVEKKPPKRQSKPPKPRSRGKMPKRPRKMPRKSRKCPSLGKTPRRKASFPCSI